MPEIFHFLIAKTQLGFDYFPDGKVIVQRKPFRCFANDRQTRIEKKIVENPPPKIKMTGKIKEIEKLKWVKECVK